MIYGKVCGKIKNKNKNKNQKLWFVVIVQWIEYLLYISSTCI